MKIAEIRSKTILSSSQVNDYVINPYVGCQHGCSYCYARSMKRFTGHREPWGDFVDVKINAPELLRKEITRKKKGEVWVSGVCDPYQPLEARYRLTRQCLEILAENRWPVVIQTRSPLVLRDMDLFKKAESWQVGLSITTADDRIRQIFEPKAPPIGARLKAVAELHDKGIATYVMIAPLLPGGENLVAILAGKVDYLILDRMNYHYADAIYARYGWREMNSDGYFSAMRRRIEEECRQRNIDCRAAY